MTVEARFEALRARLGELHGRSHALARQLGDLDLGELRAPGDLALIPVMRKTTLAAMQAAEPPFGALAVAPTSAFPRLFASPGGIYEPESAGRDPWGAAKALAAAGVAAGEIVVNCFSYHLTPGGRILESGALALGCPVIPAGPGNTEPLIAAIAHLKPSVYCGPPDFLKIDLDKARAAGADVSSLNKALVSGAALPPSLRAELEGAGVKTRGLRHRRSRNHRLRDRRRGRRSPARHARQRRARCRDRDPGNRRTRCPRQGRRDRRDPASGRLSAVAVRHRGPLGLGLFRPPQRLDGAGGSVGQGQGPVRPSGPDRRDRQAPPRARRASPRRAARGRTGRDDAARRDRKP